MDNARVDERAVSVRAASGPNYPRGKITAGDSREDANGRNDDGCWKPRTSREPEKAADRGCHDRRPHMRRARNSAPRSSAEQSKSDAIGNEGYWLDEKADRSALVPAGIRPSAMAGRGVPTPGATWTRAPTNVASNIAASIPNSPAAMDVMIDFERMGSERIGAVARLGRRRGGLPRQFERVGLEASKLALGAHEQHADDAAGQ